MLCLVSTLCCAFSVAALATHTTVDAARLLVRVPLLLSAAVLPMLELLDKHRPIMLQLVLLLLHTCCTSALTCPQTPNHASNPCLSPPKRATNRASDRSQACSCRSLMPTRLPAS